jgi:hypothetical protein
MEEGIGGWDGRMESVDGIGGWNWWMESVDGIEDEIG